MQWNSPNTKIACDPPGVRNRLCVCRKLPFAPQTGSLRLQPGTVTACCHGSLPQLPSTVQTRSLLLGQLSGRGMWRSFVSLCVQGMEGIFP